MLALAQIDFKIRSNSRVVGDFDFHLLITSKGVQFLDLFVIRSRLMGMMLCRKPCSRLSMMLIISSELIQIRSFSMSSRNDDDQVLTYRIRR